MNVMSFSSEETGVKKKVIFFLLVNNFLFWDEYSIGTYVGKSDEIDLQISWHI